jgi:predicted TIM-barrel fold metal-dependent hydrolase
MAPISRRTWLGSAMGLTPTAADRGWIDAHVHVWTDDLARYPIAAGFRKEQMKPARFTPEELLAEARPCGVTRVVLIQMSYYRFDNSYMLDTIARFPGVFRGVAIVDSNAPDAGARMRALRERGVRGFRIGGAELEAAGMPAMWACAAEEGLAICPLINPDALPALGRLCARFPDTAVVIDHFARIGADGQIREEDVARLCALARYPKTCVKLSAFYALGRKQYPYTDLLPLVRRLLDAYGPRRLMWATDSPFQLQPGHTYLGSLELIRDRLDGISAEDRAWLLGRTAERVFFS